MMIFDPDFDLTNVDEVAQLGNRAKSVQECLWISIRLVAPYAAKVPTNPNITSQTTSLSIVLASEWTTNRKRFVV